MKPLWKSGIRAWMFLLCMLLLVVGNFSQCQARNVTGAEAAAASATKMKLTWELEKEASQIQIFRNDGKVYNQFTRKKVATFNGKVKSYTDKVEYNKHYTYEVVAYKKKGKGYKKLGSDICYGFSGVALMEWSEYALSDSMTTPESVFIDICAKDGGLKPDGVEIYRKTEGGKFKRIKTVSKSLWELQYTDSTVEAHQTYYYKVRSFRTVRQKKQYAPFSEVMRYTAVNRDGKYSVKVLTGEDEALQSLAICFCLTSEEGNGKLVLGNDGCTLGNKTRGARSYMKFAQYSYDGNTWLSLKDDDMVLMPGQSIYLKFAVAPSYTEMFYYREGEGISITVNDVQYNDYFCQLYIDLDGEDAVVKLDEKYYHAL